MSNLPDSIVNDFFNFSKECPPEIPNCQDLRNQYVAEEKAIILEKGKCCCGDHSRLLKKYIRLIKPEILP